jgi:hypothetical protein
MRLKQSNLANLIRTAEIASGMKAGDIDPQVERGYGDSISDTVGLSEEGARG